MFEVILPDHARAEADTEASALYAARTLVDDRAGFYGQSRLLRKSIIITRNGQYDGRLTERARR